MVDVELLEELGFVLPVDPLGVLLPALLENGELLVAPVPVVPEGGEVAVRPEPVFAAAAFESSASSFEIAVATWASRAATWAWASSEACWASVQVPVLEATVVLVVLVGGGGELHAAFAAARSARASASAASSCFWRASSSRWAALICASSEVDPPPPDGPLGTATVATRTDVDSFNAAVCTVGAVDTAVAVAVGDVEPVAFEELPPKLAEPPFPVLEGSCPASASARSSCAWVRVTFAESSSRCSDAVSSDARVWPTLTRWPAFTDTDATVPEPGNATATRSTGVMVPVPWSLLVTVARSTVAAR